MVLAMLPLAFAAAAPGKTIVSLGTATPGGGFPVYGDAAAATINEMDPTLQVVPQNTKGSAENVPLLEAGKLDIALVQGEAALEAFNGIGRPPADLRILFAMYATPGMFVVRGDSPYRTIEDLNGQARGVRGQGIRPRAACWLHARHGLGLDRDPDFAADPHPGSCRRAGPSG